MSTAGAVLVPLTGASSAQGMETIVQDSLPGVKFLATRLAARLPGHVEIEDLIQVGLMGLLQSAERFDPGRGVKFQTYANRRVQGAMLDYLRSLDWRPRSVRQRSRRLQEASAAVEQRLGTHATQEDVAAEIGVTPLELHRWIEDCPPTGAPSPGSFRDQPADGESPEPPLYLADPADSPETVLEKEQTRKILAEAVDTLPGNERVVLSLYYFEHLTMKEIGQLLGVKQARISQLHTRAVGRLRHRMRTPEKPRPRRPFRRTS